MDAVRLIEEHRPPELRHWRRGADSGQASEAWVFEFDSMDLHLDVRCCPSARGFTIQTGRLLQKGPIFPRKKFKLLEAELRLSFMEASRQRPLESAVLVLQALESVAGLEHESARRQGRTVETRAAPPEARAWDAREISSFRTILENPRGLDSATIADTASEMLGVGPREIHAAIPPQWRVVHIESVLRPDLAARFGRYQQWLRQDLATRRFKPVLAIWHRPRWGSGAHRDSKKPRWFWN